MLRKVLFLTVLAGIAWGCGAYKQNIMFRTPEGFIPESIKDESLKTNKNYIIQKNDLLTLRIYTNNGEKLVDPNPELSQTQQTSKNQEGEIQYLVDLNGVVKFPLIGELKVEGLSLRQAEQIAQKEFEKFYKSPFVLLEFNNKRVIVLGAPGGLVIPLTNDNTTLAEVLALAKGVGNEGKANNIRVLRNDKVFVVDFTSIEGYRFGNMIIEPGDIVYVEPVRKPLAEGFRDYGTILTFLISITTLVVILTQINQTGSQ